MKCPRCQRKNPSQARVCMACGARLAVRAKRQSAGLKAPLPVSRKAPKNEEARVRDLEKRLAEALEQQTATSEILHVISSSPADVQPILDAVVESAARLCAAEDVVIFKADGGRFRVAAARGAAHYPGFEGTAVDRESVTGRAIVERQLVHVHDIMETSDFPVSRAYAEGSG